MPLDSAGTRPSVTAVIPCFNAARHVGEAIDSVLRQTGANVEIVVVNDGSTDDFDTAVAPFRSRITIVSQANAGQGTARNRGIAEARTPYVAFLDADDRWRPDKTARQVAFLETHPECGLVHTARAIIGVNGEGVPESPLAPEPVRPARGQCLVELIAGNSIIVSSVMVRRSLLDEVPFATDVSGVEDWDLWVRLAARTRFEYLDEPLTEYRVHDTNFSWDRRVMASATVRLMDGVLRRERDGDVRRAARAHRHQAILEAAHLEYERGRHLEARRWFRKASPRLDVDDVLRYAATYMPRLLHGAARRAWRGAKRLKGSSRV
jgi:glycosyltransferase involved in cell wall biosynthesis